MPTNFFHAVLAGLAVAAPIGPVGILCIRRTLNYGTLAGLSSGLGAALADAIFGSVAAFGITIVTSFIVENSRWIGIVGGLFLCLMGVFYILRKSHPKPDESAPALERNLLRSFISTFILTITNPLTILGFAVLFSALGLGNECATRHGALILVGGVFTGSALWWLTLCTIVHHIRHLLPDCWYKWINLASGLVLIGFGVLAILVRTQDIVH
jgi:threonine/homoserine/homoserine lactone efflux protein